MQYPSIEEGDYDGKNRLSLLHRKTQKWFFLMLPFRQKSRYSLFQITEKLSYFWYLIQAMCLSTIRITSVTLLLFFTFYLAQAKEYGNYDPKGMVTFLETSSGKQAGIDLNYLDQILNDLGLHATNYPPQFDTPQDRQRAIQDVKTLSGMLDILLNDPNPTLKYSCAQVLLTASDITSISRAQARRRPRSSKDYWPPPLPTRVPITCTEDF